MLTLQKIFTPETVITNVRFYGLRGKSVSLFSGNEILKLTGDIGKTFVEIYNPAFRIKDNSLYLKETENRPEVRLMPRQNDLESVVILRVHDATFTDCSGNVITSIREIHQFPIELTGKTEQDSENSLSEQIIARVGDYLIGENGCCYQI